MSKSKEHIHLRSEAVVIASQLPDNRAEALRVIDYARHMVVGFWDDASGVSDNIQRVSGTIETHSLRRPTGLPSSDPPRRRGGERRQRVG
jgi:hypothetical protein